MNYQMIVERNDISTIEGERRVLLFTINLWNNTNVKMNNDWSWTLKLIIEKIKWTNVEIKCHNEYEK